MTTLALVDLDNVLGTLNRNAEHLRWVPRRTRGSDFQWVQDDGADTVFEPQGDRSDCVVVLSANTETVAWYQLEAHYLGRLARRIARVLGHVDPRGVHWEFALTLASPQSVDRALMQLLPRAASKSAAITFDCVAIVTDDRGLRERVGERLGARWAMRPASAAGLFLTRFLLPRGWTRHHAETSVTLAMGEAPVPGLNAVWITSAQASAWASNQTLQRGASLVETAARVNCHPAILSQVSITRSSFRGVSRMFSPANSVIEACSPDDGLEISTPAKREERHPGGVVASSLLGTGAAHITGLEATVRTALPLAWCVRRRLENDVLLGPTLSRLDDASLLAREPVGRPMGWMLKVSLKARRATPMRPIAALLAEVLPDLAGEVQGWWTEKGGRKSRSTFEVIMADSLLPTSVEVRAQQAVECNEIHRELILMAPSVAAVVMAQDLPRGMIGLAGGERLPVAFLSLDADLAKGAEVQVVPIQTLSVSMLQSRCPSAGLSDSAWAMLRRLPLTVARLLPISVRSIQSTASGSS